MSPRVGIVGAGSWGTALGHVLARNGHRASLWSHDPDVAEQISERSRNEKYLPEHDLDPSLRAHAEMERAVAAADVVISASPSHVVREVMAEAADHVPPSALLVSASKGLEIDTRMRMSEVLEEVFGDRRSRDLVVLSGPSFAVEVARELPTAVAAASRSRENARRIQHLFQNDHLRVYTQSDVVGTELGAAVKNVIALAAGMSDGLGLGNNARAALITRGLAEIERLVRKLGGDELTLSGLAGVGDLILTCTGDLSRNRTAGVAIGRGGDVEQVLGGMEQVVEGVRTTRAVRDLADSQGVEMPIVEAVFSILYESVEPTEALSRLMSRQPKPERWS